MLRSLHRFRHAVGFSTPSRVRCFGGLTDVQRCSTEPLNKDYVVHTVPLFQDNYAYIVHNLSSEHIALVDPADPEHVLNVLENDVGVRADPRRMQVWTTHHHHDHAGGNTFLRQKFGDELVIVGSAHEEIPEANLRVDDNDVFQWNSSRVRVVYTPCHTKGHIMYLLCAPRPENCADVNTDLMEKYADTALFSGDTLFVGGCGRFFEGEAFDMLNSLQKLEYRVPPSTKVFCGHEYTLSNLLFALTIEPDNRALREKLEWATTRLSHKRPTVPSVMSEEMLFNPFMRTRHRSVQIAVGESDATGAMQKLREMKNSFVPSQP